MPATFRLTMVQANPTVGALDANAALALSAWGQGKAAGADLKAGAAAASKVKGFLTEVADGVIGAVVYDYDAQGRNIGRRLAGVSTSGAQLGSHDVTKLITEDEPYPGVSRFN